MQERIPVGLSMPRKFVTRIDRERGDIPRSRYVLRLIETGIMGIGKEKEKEGHGSQPARPSMIVGAAASCEETMT